MTVLAFVAMVGGVAVFAVWGFCVVAHETVVQGRPLWVYTTAVGAELRPFVLPLIIVQYLILAVQIPLWLAALCPTCELLIWRHARHLPDDDRWTRRRQRVRDRLRRLAIRLGLVT